MNLCLKFFYSNDSNDSMDTPVDTPVDTTATAPETEAPPKKSAKKKAPPHPNSQDPVTGGFVKEIWLKKPSKKLERDLWHLDWIYYRHRYKLPVREYYKKHFGRTIRIVFRGQSQPTEMTITKEHYAE